MTTEDRADGAWEHFSHDADIGLVGLGPTKAEAFRQAALALTAVVTDPGRVKTVTSIDLICRAANDERLLVEWLNTLVYEMAVRSMLFDDFTVVIADGELHATARGEPIDVERHEPAVEIDLVGTEPRLSLWQRQRQVGSVQQLALHLRDEGGDAPAAHAQLNLLAFPHAPWAATLGIYRRTRTPP